MGNFDMENIPPELKDLIESGNGAEMFAGGNFTLGCPSAMPFDPTAILLLIVSARVLLVGLWIAARYNPRNRAKNKHKRLTQRE